MARTVVSTKYQVVIPREVRRELKLRAGQVLEIVVKNGVITLVPDRPLSELRGFVRGIRTDRLREKRDRA